MKYRGKVPETSELSKVKVKIDIMDRVK